MDTQPIALPAQPTSRPTQRIARPAARWPRVALAVYLVVIGLITLSPSAPGPTRGFAYWVITTLQRVLPLRWSEWEFLLNIAMFVPLGILLVLVFGARLFWVAALAALALTFSIEGLQQFIPYRVPDTRDLLANGLGGVVGTLLGVALLRLRPPRTTPR